jgi:ribosomal protein S27AE
MSINPLSSSNFKPSLPENRHNIRTQGMKIKRIKDCPRCLGTSVFLIDKLVREYWCTQCEMSYRIYHSESSR